MECTAFRRSLRSIVVTGFLLISPTVLRAAGPLTLHVACDGNDMWSGKRATPAQDGRDGPFATLERARDEIRTMKKAKGLPDGGATVNIHGGNHFRGQAFRLEEQDSGTASAPIVYAAAQGADVILNAAKTVGGFEKVTDPAVLRRLPGGARGKVFQTDLRRQGIVDFGKIGLQTKQRPQAGLEPFCNGKPLTLARWPNEGFVRIAGAPNGMKGGMFAYYGDRPKRWANEADPRGCGYWAHDWAASNVAFETIDTEKRIITTKAPHSSYGYRKDKRYFAYNLLCELDQAGEWYLDRDKGLLYVWPPCAMDAAKIEVSFGPGFLILKNVSHVTFRKLIFQGCRGEAVSIRDGDNVQLIGCTLRNLGTGAATIWGGTNHRIIGCDFYDINEGGVHCVAGKLETLAPCHHVIENCVFTRLGGWQRTYVPAVRLWGVGVRIAHNLMHNFPHSMVLFTGNDNIIEYNEVHSMGYEGGEMGAFYCGRNWTLNGNIIRYNYLHDIYNPCPQRNRAFMLDDGAAGITMYGNIIARVAEGISLSYLNNVIDNNVFVDCHPAVACWGGQLQFPPFDIERGHNKTRWPGLAKLPLDLPPWSTRFPEMLPFREAIRNGGPVPSQCKARVTRNIIWEGEEEWTGFHMTKDKDAWVINDNLAHVDPLFQDAAANDFRLKPESPAFAKGFQPIPVEKIGLQNTKERASWPVKHEVRKDMCRDYRYVAPPAPPRPDIPPIRAPRLVSTPTIDGVLSDGEWTMAPTMLEQDVQGGIIFSPSRA